MKSVPPLEELFNMAGLSLPEYLGKRKDASAETPEAPVSPAESGDVTA